MSAPKRKPRRRTFELPQGDYSQLLDEKAIEVEKAFAEEAAERRLAANTKKTVADDADEEFESRRSMQLAAEYDELAAEAKKTAIVLELEKPPRTQVSELRDHHPPRDDDERKEYGFNVDAFYEAIAPLCVVDFDDDKPAARWATDDELMKDPDTKIVVHPDWPPLYESMSSAEWELLKATIRDLISGVTQLPKSSLVSTLREMNAVESKSQQDGRSPRPLLTDGTSETTSTR